MSKPFAIALIVIFSIHFIVFLGLYIRHKRTYHLYLAGAFVWLILYQVMRWWWVDVAWFGYSAHVLFRVAAWVTTGIGMVLFIRFKYISSGNHKA